MDEKRVGVAARERESDKLTLPPALLQRVYISCSLILLLTAEYRGVASLSTKILLYTVGY
jgi:hypothetical protein